MRAVVEVPFQVTGWEPEPLELGEPGPVAFGRVTLRKRFSGPLTGTGVVDGADGTSSGLVLPGTRTGELTGLRGDMTITHDGSGAVLTLDHELPRVW